MPSSLSTPEMKYYVMHYYRFQRQYPIVATEVGVFGDFIADVLASDLEKEFIEVEIKISESDMLSDFQHKSMKHTAYLDSVLHKEASQLTQNDRKLMPTKFLYAVPREMRRFATEQVKGTPYGLIIVDPLDATLGNNSFIKIVKHSDIINRSYPKALERRAMMRMSSEIINLYESQLDI